MTTTEKEKEWRDLSDIEIHACLAAHAIALKLNWKDPRHMATMRRIFDLGRPKIVLTYDSHNHLESCRIHENSAAVMKVLIRQYL